MQNAARIRIVIAGFLLGVLGARRIREAALSTILVMVYLFRGRESVPKPP